MNDISKTVKEQSPIKECFIEKNNNNKSSYVVLDGNTGETHQPICLGTFMGALEAHCRGIKLTDEEKKCLEDAGYKI